MFISKLVVERVISNYRSNCIDSFAARRSNDFVANLNDVNEIIKLVCRIIRFAACVTPLCKSAMEIL